MKLLETASRLGIKAKLVILFVLLKVIPLLLIALIAVRGALELEEHFSKDAKQIMEQSKGVVKGTADMAIQDSIKALDDKSKSSLERLTLEIAHKVADFLHERDADLLYLSQSRLTEQDLVNFYLTKRRPLIHHEPYRFDDQTQTWVSLVTPKNQQAETKAEIKDNEREFHKNLPKNFKTHLVPIYKEITFLNLKGQEVMKVSSIDPKLKDVSKKENTYLKAESYLAELAKLDQGEIWVGEVTGRALPTHMIGPYTKARAEKMNRPFDPKTSAYAGKENPLGVKFDGILRFATPVYQGKTKKGYLTMALDHRHIMEFTDYVVPTGEVQSNISDAFQGNYAFMWDHVGRNISHPRDYFIVGYDDSTGQPVPGWISEEMAERWQRSGVKDLNQFLATQPWFLDQSLDKKPNGEQVKAGYVSLDCRFLNFAPQCQGWFQLTREGGYGSFIIFWSKVWKLTTAAAIPYFTGRYGETARGFGFVTIGANVDEFHLAASNTQKRVEEILSSQTAQMDQNLRSSTERMALSAKSMIKNISISTLLMMLAVILIAIWMSEYITKKILLLQKGTREFAANRLDYRIEIKTKDEIGQLSDAFNQMAEQLMNNQEEQKRLINQLNLANQDKDQLLAQLKRLNESLEIKVEERTHKLNETLEEIKTVNQRTLESIRFSHMIQSSLLPKREQVKEFLPESFFIWEPRDIVGGDIFLCEPTQQGYIVVVIDCTGHGVPGALLTMLATAGIRRIVGDQAILDPASIWDQLNQFVLQSLHQEEEVSLADVGLDGAICLVDLKQQKLTFAGARLPLYYTQQGQIQSLQGQKISIGYRQELKNRRGEESFANQELPIEPGMGVYLATDGFTDQKGGPRGLPLGSSRFKELLSQAVRHPLEEQERILLGALREYQQDHPRMDDITLVGFRIP